MLLDLKNGSQDAFDGPVHALSVSATHVPLPKIVSESICCDWESDGGDNLSLVSQASCSAELETVFMISTETNESMPILTAYKRVDQKVKPVPGVFPEDARVTRQFPEDPLASLLPLPIHPPDFISGERLTEERLKEMNINYNNFLWPEEEKLFNHIMLMNEKTLAFEECHRGTLRDDYFSPYIIPYVPHVPWAYSNIPIPPGIKEKVIQLLKEKIEAGVYEPSQSSYRSRWFCVLKKNGKLRIVHDLQPLNKVTIQDAGLPPILDDFVEPFAKRQCYTVFDLFWGFDARKVHPESRDMTSFLTPLGLLRITSMPMGFTNSPAEFQQCMVFILRDEIPQTANVFIDDLPIKGPTTQYLDNNGNPEILKENPGIRRFIWEHANDVHRIMHRIGHAGATFSPKKSQVCRPEVLIVGQKCTPEGRLPDDVKVQKVLDWPPLKTQKEVRGFLGLCGTMRIWIKDYTLIARPLSELIRQNIDFIWDDRRQTAFDNLKTLITSAPVLRPIDYESSLPVILSVDSSKIAVGIILSQQDENGNRHPARYGSLPMNERESNYSQPKLELYGLFRALRHFRLYLVGVKNLHVEVDAKYIKGMLNDPDLQPNATINRWIQGIGLFDFTLIHVPAERHKGPDALSRRELADHETIEEENDEWLDDIALCVTLAKKPCKNIVPVLLSKSLNQDQLLHDILYFLTTLKFPSFSSEQSKQRFLKKVSQYFSKDEKLFRKNREGPPLLVIFDHDKRQSILEQAHEKLGHRGEQAVLHTIKQRFFWPNLYTDVVHHVRSCHECQIRSLRKVYIPITVSTPATVFTKIYIDIMLMPKAQGYRYIVAARDDLSRASEGRALKKATAKAVSQFLWEQIICRYGAVGQIVTDNGSETKGAFEILANRYGIPQIRISPYNSRANGVVERSHFTIREAIVKACKGDISQWPNKVHQAFFADRVTTSRITGYSPFYLLHGIDPVLPFDLTEATCLVQGFYEDMPTEELLALRIRQLDKRARDIEKASRKLIEARFKSKEQFERLYHKKLAKTKYQSGELVLVRNTAIESELNKKTKPRYLGPFQVVRQTEGGSYVLKEMDGTVSRRGIAAFRLIPYRNRNETFELMTKYDGNLSDDSDEDEISENEF